VFVPNSQIWSNPVINYSRGGTQRIDVTIDLVRRDQVDGAIAELTKVVAVEPRVLTGSTLAPTVAVDSYPSQGGVRLHIGAWVRDPDAPYAVDDLRGHARDALATAGLAVAGRAAGTAPECTTDDTDAALTHS